MSEPGQETIFDVINRLCKEKSAMVLYHNGKYYAFRTDDAFISDTNEIDAGRKVIKYLEGLK